MRTFQALSSTVVGYLLHLAANGLAPMHQRRRTFIVGVLVPAAVLLVIAAVNGQQITFIPKGGIFRPGGALAHPAHRLRRNCAGRRRSSHAGLWSREAF